MSQLREKAGDEFRFGGHQTFALRISWLPKAATVIDEGRDVFTDPVEGIVALGLGKNMVEALRCWVEAFGIAEKTGHRLELTDLGSAVFGRDGYDRYLEDDQTLWLLHWNVSTLSKGPFFAWELLVNRWNEPGFSASEVLEDFAQEARRTGRPLSPVSARQHLDVFIHTYVTGKAGRSEDGLDSPLAALGLLRRAGDRERPDGKSEPVFAFDLQRKPMIGQALFEHCIQRWWDDEFEFEETVPLRELAFGRRSPGRVFRMPEEEIRERVERLSRSDDGSISLIESLNQLVVRRRKRVDATLSLAKVYGKRPTRGAWDA